MQLSLLAPAKALDSTYKKELPRRDRVGRFAQQWQRLCERAAAAQLAGQSEEHLKGLLKEFLLDTEYAGFDINTKSYRGLHEADLVIQHAANHPVQVLFELKRPGSPDMIAPDNLNRKALHEALTYYLWEREVNQNREIKHIVITDLQQWFVFSGQDFYRAFGSNSALLRFFQHWKEGRTDSDKTSQMYRYLQQFLAGSDHILPVVHFTAESLRKAAASGPDTSGKTLLYAFKFFSPEHLLQTRQRNDSNVLNKDFYFEMLYLLGLEETKEANKKIIQRAHQPHPASLIENAITKIRSERRLERVGDRHRYGPDTDQQLFGVALELAITWINRVLFLKLLEAQLITYHNGDPSYAFLDPAVIREFDDLNALFFEVLAVQPDKREASIGSRFAHIPYLNSSLFETTDLEKDTISISGLRDSLALPLFGKTVLRDGKNRREGNLPTLSYLLEFLNAYDFGAETRDGLVDTGKSLINASVLGLIFEKINGYQDGAFFTPGFITMYMARESIRGAVVEKFQEAARKKNTPLNPSQGQEHTPNPSQEGLTSTAGANLPGDATNQTPLLRGAKGGFQSPDDAKGASRGFQSPGGQEHTPNPSQEGLTSTAGANLPGDATDHFPLLGGARGGFQAPDDATSPTRRNIIPYNPNLKELARDLRNNSTRSEIILWKELKGKFEGKYDFHRQKPLNNYIADFFCYELMLAIELDGESHDSPGVLHKDVEKERKFNSLGINVLRFRDTDVFHNLDKVLETIRTYIQGYEKGDLSVFWAENTPLNPLSRGDFNSPGDATDHFPLLGGTSGGFQSLAGQEHTPNPSQEGLTSTAGANLPGDATDHFPLLGGASGRFQSLAGQEHTPNPSQEGLTSTAGANLPGDATDHFPLLGGARGGFQAPGEATGASGEFQSPAASGGFQSPGDATNPQNTFTSLHHIYDLIGPGRPFSRKQANDLINSITICDPAVGSGHFLVSALNELIAIKSELGILEDEDGKLIRDWAVRVEDDELVIEDHDGDLFRYQAPKPGSTSKSERQRVQETLFREKRAFIERSLFGVDINPNSVKICRLRLWIELLKHTYYRAESGYHHLETLPNLDINIKVGNSLVSRYRLSDPISAALKSQRQSVKDYLSLVQGYRQATDPDEKQALRLLIDQLKKGISGGLSQSDADYARLSKAKEIFYDKFGPDTLFAVELTKKQQAERERMSAEIDKLAAKVEEKKSGTRYRGGFEWRFEFPEVLGEDGRFLGFDVVMANPPYIRQEEIREFKPLLEERYQTFAGTADLYVYFVELGMDLLKPRGQFCYIFPNKWMRANYGLALRQWIRQHRIKSLIDFGDLPVFEEATTYPIVLSMTREAASPVFRAAELVHLDFDAQGLEAELAPRWFDVRPDQLQDEGWTLARAEVQALLGKLRQTGVPLGEYVGGRIYYGIKTGLNEAFVIDRETRDRLIAGDPRSAEVIKPFLAGKDIKRWRVNFRETYVLFIPWHFPLHEDSSIAGSSTEAEEAFKKEYPAVYQHLLLHKNALLNRNKAETGIRYEWYALQRAAATYYEAFSEPKIMYQEIATYSTFAYDEDQFFVNNKVFIMPGAGLGLLGLLNSKLVWFFLNQIASKLNGGALAMQSPYVMAIPIVEEAARHPRIETLVTEILHLKAVDAYADTLVLEAEIDELVCGLYGLSEEERALVG